MTTKTNKIRSRLKRITIGEILVTASLAAAMIQTADTEHRLALAVGGHDPYAWLYPVSLDLYAAAAFRSHKRGDIAVAIGLMMGSQILAHLIEADIIKPNVWVVISVVSVIPILLWRGHLLGAVLKEQGRQRAEEQQTTDATCDAVHETLAAPVERPTRRRNASARQTAEQRRAHLRDLIKDDPDLTQPQAAEHLDISDRQIRNLTNAKWTDYKQSILATA